jgi:hypothetical protein
VNLVVEGSFRVWFSSGKALYSQWRGLHASIEPIIYHFTKRKSNLAWEGREGIERNPLIDLPVPVSNVDVLTALLEAVFVRQGDGHLLHLGLGVCFSLKRIYANYS